MLARYRIIRGTRPKDDPMPKGVRHDTRKHTQHVLRPTAEMVETFLGATNARGFARFKKEYLALLAERFAKNRAPFDVIAEIARRTDLYLGCNCPTERQPDVRHCHTWLALGFLAKKYPDVDVRRD